MSRVSLSGNPSGTGTFTIASPNSNTDRTLSLPDQTGTLLTGSGALNINASAPTSSLTLDASGRLLVGATTSPSASTVRAAIQGASGADAYYQFGNGSGGGGLIGSGLGGGISLYTYTGGFGSETYTERARIDSSGRITTPYQPAWSADFNGFTCTNAGQIYYPVYNTPEINVGGHFNTSTGRMTAPVSGVYLLMGSFLRNSSAYVFRGQFYKNGVRQTEGEYRTTEAFSGYNETSTFTQIVSAVAGDTLGWGIACDVAGGSIYPSSYNYFAGYLLG
jgi:hypothetical protein